MDSLWDATRGSTPGRSAADQAKSSVLLMRMGVMMTRSLEFKPVPRLMEWPLEALEERSPQLVRDERPDLLWVEIFA